MQKKEQKSYYEHGTYGEKLAAWQKIISAWSRPNPYEQKMEWLNKHYIIDKEWAEVIDIIKIPSTSNNAYLNLLDDLILKFNISVNKCECKGQPLDLKYYDVNGMCKKCELKIKQ